MSHKNSVLFKAALLVPVIQEARQHGCNIALVKDDGLYMLSEKGPINPATRRRLVAYAEGFDPSLVVFDEWYHPLHDICGGDDFVETLEADSPLFDRVVNNSVNLRVEFTASSFLVTPVIPDKPKEEQT
ncbi:MAG: DUF3085 domain-containing protein [Scandinavium sp.]|uniref:DUF3085 domain-containing protein n=1 Tax=Scandinavium sp. TaxID=2830653 RepID=UPI003F394F4F